jgi:RimJ/RimL family protein N-acetyltransferase
MFKQIKIREAIASTDRDFYLKCFLNQDWLESFDLNFNNPHINREQYINQKIAANYPDLTRLIIYNSKTNQQIAFTNILIDNQSSKRCSLHGGVAPELRGKIYGGVGLYLALKLIFSEINMNKVSCTVYDFNFPSFKLLESAGFILEGILREYDINHISNQFVDVKLYSLLKSNFSQSKIYNLFSTKGL